MDALALQCAQLSAEIYQDFATITFPSTPGAEVTLIQSEGESNQNDTQAAALFRADINQLIIVFRGSESLMDWLTNLRFRQQVYPYGDDTTTKVRFHQGFMNAYFCVREAMKAVLAQHPDAQLVFTGHSLGGALATVAALDSQYALTTDPDFPTNPAPSLQVYTFGAPRVGNGALVKSFQRRVPHCQRYTYGRDIVPTLPRWWQGYRHVAPPQPLGPRWNWRFLSRKIRDHMIDNYVQSLAALVS